MPDKPTIKAILIDAVNHTVEPIFIERDFKAYYEKLNTDIIEVGARFSNGDIIYVNEEGLLKNPEHFFAIAWYSVRGLESRVFAGNGLIVGTRLSHDAPAKSVLRDFEVRFLTLAEVRKLGVNLPI